MAAVVWVVATVNLLLGVIGGYLALKRSQATRLTDQATGCLSSGETPEADMFMIDLTNHLSEGTASQIIQAIHDDVKSLPRYSQVIIVPFGDDTATPLAPIFARCLPGQVKDARLDESGRFLGEDFAGFEKALSELAEKLRSLPASPTSPITAQITRAASDPVLHWRGKKRKLVLFSDGLESSIYWTKDLKLRDPAPHILKNVSVEYFELGNARSQGLQSQQMREQWRDWFEKAGANVRVTAPGYAAG